MQVIVVPGGWDSETDKPLQSVECFDFRSGTWSTGEKPTNHKPGIPDFPSPRSAYGIAVVNDLLYVIGGFHGETEVDIFDPAKELWTNGSKMQEKRAGLAVAVLDAPMFH